MTDDVSPEIIKNTQKLLGKHIKKPPLTEKLLKKPPFRFLHDIVTSVIKETGFLKGLYSDADLQSDNVKEREAKVAFLTKLIDAVKAITQNELQARPSKIISGLEPKETNLLLQAIGGALDKKLDSSQYVAQLKGSKEQSKPKAKLKTLTKNETDKEKTKKSSSRTTVASQEKTKETRLKKQDSEQGSNRAEKKKVVKKDASPRESKNKPVVKVSPKDSKSKPSSKRETSKDSDRSNKREKVDLQKDNGDVVKTENEINSTINTATEKLDENVDNLTELRTGSELKEGNLQALQNIIESKNEPQEEEQTDIPDIVPKISEKENIPSIEDINKGALAENLLERPKSARPRSGDLKKDRIPSARPKNIDFEREIKIENGPIRPRSSLRPPSVRPSSARPGAPRLRPDSALPLKEMIPLGKINVIVENFSSKDDEEETVVIQSTPDVEPGPPPTILDMPADKGHLVEQILEQLHEDDVLESTKSKVDIDWEQEGFRGRDAMSKEIGQLRNAIQILTRTANPLGKLMNFLHEDLEAMHMELNMWITTKRQIKAEIDNQKKINEEITKPLRNKLLELEENIRKQEDECSALRSEIFRNDMRIKELLTDQI